MLVSSRASACHGFEQLRFPPGIFDLFHGKIHAVPQCPQSCVKHQCLLYSKRLLQTW